MPTRRTFLKGVAGTTLVPALLRAACAQEDARPPRASRPNILWISCEDIGPDLGCYGDDYAVTPNIDRLAREGCRYTNAFVPFPVCAPTRSSIITGMFPGSIGSMHMRTKNRGYQCVPPPYVKCFTEYLRASGYFCSNQKKTDYQFSCPFTAWDAKGDWRNSKRPRGAPFFSVINYMGTHESRCWRTDSVAHDPGKAEVPPYYPDTPVVRRSLARYYDNISALDVFVGSILKKLEDDGLAGRTLVCFWSDHGRGLPRHKRWPYDSGLRVPLIIRWPGRIKPGSVNEELVSLMDLAPTMLTIAGLEAPRTMQGRVILGEKKQPEPEYLYGGRNRMDKNSYDHITKTPVVESTSDSTGRRLVSLRCSTEGASIGYLLGGGRWLLYHEPVAVEIGTVLRAKAVRLGYKASSVVEHRVGGKSE